MTKQEFLLLYEKDLQGNCTPEEKTLLLNYRDEMKLADGQWIENDINQSEVHDRILNRLHISRQNERPVRKMKIPGYWSGVAASLLITVSVGLWYYSHNTKPAVSSVTLLSNKVNRFKPGGNKAYLTLGNGKQISLDDKESKVVTRSGVKLANAKSGKLAYVYTDVKISENIPEINTITTPIGKQYQVVLNDGSHVWLNAGSSLKFPVFFAGSERSVELTGEAYFEVAKNKDKPFIVHTNGTDVKVLGTHFNINAYADNLGVTTTLLEGSVRFTKGLANSLLRPGQMGIAPSGSKSISIKSADIESVMDWKSNYFVFHNEGIVSIMKRVSRWYNVDVIFQDDLSDREFGGTVSRYKDITELLNNMELTHAIHYKIEGRRVTIMK